MAAKILKSIDTAGMSSAAIQEIINNALSQARAK